MFNKVELLLLFILIAIVFAGLVFSFALFVFRGGTRNLPKSELSVGGKVLSVEVARSALDKMRGLSGREILGEDEGMLFTFDKEGNYGFWMKDMKFPIDVVWIDKGKITGFSENSMPEPDKQIWNLKIYYPPDVVDEVLEVNAGFVSKNKIQVGDEVSLR